MQDDEIAKYGEQFRSIVLFHIRNTLPPAEWQRLRNYAQTAERQIVYQAPIPDASPEDVLRMGLASVGMPVSEALKGNYKALATDIGSIEGAPVYYIEGEGYYIWGPEINSKLSWDATITWPAYPPSW